MVPYEQNQQFAKLRFIRLDGKLERFVTKNGKSVCQTRVRQTIAFNGLLRIWQLGLYYCRK